MGPLGSKRDRMIICAVSVIGHSAVDATQKKNVIKVRTDGWKGPCVVNTVPSRGSMTQHCMSYIEDSE